MTTAAAFLAAIAASPDDDLPKLVYADWLDEGNAPPQFDSRNAFNWREQVARRRILADPSNDTIRLEYADLCEQYATPESRCSNCGGRGEAPTVVACPHCGGNLGDGEWCQECGGRGELEMDRTCGTCSGTSGLSDGRNEHAEFIRLQVEIARIQANPSAGVRKLAATVAAFVRPEIVSRATIPAALRQRERELFNRHATVWFGERWAILHCGPPEEDSTATVPDLGHAFVTRGFVSEYHGPMDRWCGVACGRCHGSGRYEEHDGAIHFGSHTPFTCDACHGVGRTSAIGPDVVALSPVEMVVLTDQPTVTFLSLNGRFRASAELPLTDCTLSPPEIWFETIDIARQCYRDWVSDTLLAWAKSHRPVA